MMGLAKWTLVPNVAFVFFYKGVLFDWALILYGTATNPLEGNAHFSIPAGATPIPASTAFPTEPTSEK